MMNYKKGKNVEVDIQRDEIPIAGLPTKFLWMHVKGGTKVSNVTDPATEALNSNKEICVVWSGAGGAISKTISCAEIMKRQIPELLQVTRMNYKNVEEYWEPLLPGLDEIKVVRKIPYIHIMQTLDVIESVALGHQLSKASFWVEHSVEPTSKPRPNTSRASGHNSSNKSQNNSKKKASDNKKSNKP